MAFLPAIAAAATTFGLNKLFNKKSKVSTPEYQKVNIRPQESLEFTKDLRNLARTKMQGEGFGPGFVDRQTSPAIADIEARFQGSTLPRISSELSKRGIARSQGPDLATDQILRAEQQKNRDINSLVAQFQLLNEQQKKADVTEGMGLAERLQSQESDIARQTSLADAGINEFGLQKQRTEAGIADTRQKNFGALLAGLQPSREDQTLKLLEKILGSQGTSKTQTDLIEGEEEDFLNDKGLVTKALQSMASQGGFGF